MKMYPQCYACITDAAERTLSILGLHDKEKQEVINKVKSYLEHSDDNLTPMEISFGMNEIIQQETGVIDPIKFMKKDSNQNALKLIDRAEEIVKASTDSLFEAIKVAIAGNIIDYGVRSEYDLSKTLEEVLGKNPFINDYLLLKERIAAAKTITFLADNAGEIVFDKLLIEQIRDNSRLDKINLIIKKYPFGNDVIVEDLEGLGFEAIPNLEIIALENLTSKDYSKLIQSYVEQADLTISKGQGNFELLYEKKLGLFFLFIVKCGVVSDILKSQEGDVVISYS